MRRLVGGLVVALAMTGPTTPAHASSDYSIRGVDRTVPIERPTEQYVALGDSFTAAPLVPDADTSDGCGRSTSNYPHLLAAALDLDLVDVSCGGADTTNLTKRQPTTAGPALPQLDALTRRTTLVTMGMGGNDFGVFATIVTLCPSLRSSDPTGAPCRETLRNPDGSDQLTDRIAQTRTRLEEAVTQIRERSPRARIVLVGYPQLPPSEGTCTALPLADGDYAYALEINKALDDAVRDAAQAQDVDFVDVWGPSQGHHVCSDEPWVNGKDTDFAAALSYHPFAVQQEAVADLLADRLR